MSDNMKSLLQSFRNDERGAIAILFAGATILMVMICGLALDVARSFHAKTRIAAALDAAALAAAKGIRLQGLNVTQAKALATKVFNENYNASGANNTGAYADIKAIDITINPAKSAVDIKVDADVKTAFGGIAGIDKFSFRTAGAAIFEAQDIELALQLDVTGSMGGSKIADLKLATKDLVDILIPDTPTGQKIRVGLAPYAAGVNAGSYAQSINGNAAAPDNCVYERLDTQYQDTDNCPNATILPMTDDKTLLKNTVDTYSASGFTAGHLGTAWAWYLLSPNWSAIWPTASKPEAYTNSGVRKIAVLMTDGEYNTVGGSNNQGTASTTFARDTCQEMKAKGIVVYTVGFQLASGSTAEQTMQQCASDLGKAYLASDGAQLRAAFRDIAENIARLRLTS
jgi:Flp pilus assembly protein TadG